ncbi:hypothetical protein BSL78_23914 [Apostichopus japonicus]|uniref:WSC domain-containing protein n=1 Tax=Stichopus japonicus TaxID=307972 RepID=A0A2G8JU48_STIJA|nr:hypothetical protein BSL78_23914 [Apostichopus japonicus]
MREKTTDAMMTVSMCSNKCAELNYTVYGLIYGNRCHCGMITDVINITRDLEPASRCNTLCSGVDRCGANKHMAVYKGNEYRGCYDDSGQHSTFNPINDLTLEVCADECRNSTFWSVLHGNKCSCRSQMPPNSTRKDDKHCKENGEKCTGGEKCGASGYIDLYVNIVYHGKV